MKNNKSNISIDMLIKLALGIIVFVILIVFASKYIGESAKETGGAVTSSRDYDKDGVADYFDKCKCKYADTGDGCPSGYTVEQKKNSDCYECQGELKPKRCPD